MSEYKLNLADFLDEADMKVFQYCIDHPGAVLMEIVNVGGGRVVRNRLPFSFYFSDKNAVHQAHGIKVKIFFGIALEQKETDGYLELHGDYKYSQLTNNKLSSKELKTALEFFKTNKVLFVAAWEGVLDPNDILLYF